MKKENLLVLVAVCVMSTSISATGITITKVDEPTTKVITTKVITNKVIKTITAQMKPQMIRYDGTTSIKTVIEYEKTNYMNIKEFGNMLGISVSYKEVTLYVGEAGSAITDQTITSGTVKSQKITAQLKEQRFKGEGTMGVSGMTHVIEYNGAIYIPLKTLGALAHTTISYERGLIYVGEAGATLTARNKSDNKSKPIPVGTTQIVTTKNKLKNSTAKICVEEVLSGKAAWEVLKDNKMISAAPEGKEYIIARISFELISVDDEGVVSFSSSLGENNSGVTSMKGIIPISYGDFEIYRSNNERYKGAAAQAPQPILTGEISTGDYIEGWGAYLVDKNDKGLKLLYGHNSTDGKGGVWFSLN